MSSAAETMPQERELPETVRQYIGSDSDDLALSDDDETVEKEQSLPETAPLHGSEGQDTQETAPLHGKEETAADSDDLSVSEDDDEPLFEPEEPRRRGRRAAPVKKRAKRSRGATEEDILLAGRLRIAMQAGEKTSALEAHNSSDENEEGQEPEEDDGEEYVEEGRAAEKRRASTSGAGSKSKEKKQKRSKEDKAAMPMDVQPAADARVDPYCEIDGVQIQGRLEDCDDSAAEQYGADNEVYCAALSKSSEHIPGDAGRKFAVLQMARFSRGSEPRWCVFMRWGRVGTAGSCHSNELAVRRVAVKRFEEHFLKLTGNNWSERHLGLVARKGKHEVVDVDFVTNLAELTVVGAAQSDYADSEVAPLALDAGARDIAQLLCDVKPTYARVAAMGIAMEQMPLCRLSKPLIGRAFSALRTVQFIVENCSQARTQSEHAELVSATHKFYGALPHTKSADISTPEMLLKYRQTVESLAHVEHSLELARTERLCTPGVHALDRELSLLRTGLKALEREGSEHSLVARMVTETYDPLAGGLGFSLGLRHVASVQRQGEAARYRPFECLPNKMLLWHGVRLQDCRAVLRHGLRCASPEAPTTGYGLGKGLLFHDVAARAVQAQCHVSPAEPVAMLLLVEVALGAMQAVKRGEPLFESPEAGRHSLLCKGALAPGAEGAAVMEGVTWHLGDVGRAEGALPTEAAAEAEASFNEYMVFDDAQFCVRYAVAVDVAGLAVQAAQPEQSAPESQHESQMADTLPPPSSGSAAEAEAQAQAEEAPEAEAEAEASEASGAEALEAQASLQTLSPGHEPQSEAASSEEQLKEVVSEIEQEEAEEEAAEEQGPRRMVLERADSISLIQENETLEFEDDSPAPLR